MYDPEGLQSLDYQPVRVGLADGVAMMNKQQPTNNAISVGLLLIAVALSGCSNDELGGSGGTSPDPAGVGGCAGAGAEAGGGGGRAPADPAGHPNEWRKNLAADDDAEEHRGGGGPAFRPGK